MEEMLTSAVMPTMSIYHLPHGLYGYSGHAINLPQDVHSFVSTLPQLPSQLDIVLVRKEGSLQSHRDFHVGRSVVYRALQWLITNNKYYRANQVHIDGSVLARLPEDGNPFNVVSSVVDNSTCEHEISAAENGDPYNAHLSRSFVLVAPGSLTEQEAVRCSVHERQSNQVSTSLMWPSIGGTPIDEFTTKGYYSCAFSTLFPTGADDFLGLRQNQDTIGNYFKHLMMYDDRRFAKHPQFRFFALNTDMRWRALQTGRIYIRQHPSDVQLSVEDLSDMVGREGETFSNRALKLFCQPPWYQAVLVLTMSPAHGMVDTLGIPTLFFTWFSKLTSSARAFKQSQRPSMAACWLAAVQEGQRKGSVESDSVAYCSLETLAHQRWCQQWQSPLQNSTSCAALSVVSSRTGSTQMGHIAYLPQW